MALLGRARSRVRKFFLYLAHVSVLGKENFVWAADGTARMSGQACAASSVNVPRYGV